MVAVGLASWSSDGDGYNDWKDRLLNPAFEHVVSRTVLGNDIRFTATADLVASEYGLSIVSVGDIRRWLEENDERATQAAFILQLSVGGYAKGADRVIRLTIEDLANAV